MKALNRPVMIRFLAISALLLVGIGANAALYLRPQGEVRAVSGVTRAKIGTVSLAVPRAYVRNAGQWAGGRLERLDLALLPESYAPLPPISPDRPDAPLPERLSLTLTTLQPGADGAERFQMLHARFIRAETVNHPSGLVSRAFRKGTPYEDQEIHIGAGSNRLFTAICPLPGSSAIEPCLARFTTDGVAVELRFPLARLGEWRMMQGRISALIAEWRSRAASGG